MNDFSTADFGKRVVFGIYFYKYFDKLLKRLGFLSLVVHFFPLSTGEHFCDMYSVFPTQLSPGFCRRGKPMGVITGV